MKSRSLLYLFIAFALTVFTIGFLLRRVILNTINPNVVETQNTLQPSEGYPELVTKPVIEGLSNVWDIAFLPDQTVLFTERSGTLSKVDAGNKQIISTIPNVAARGEGGLMGLAVDPEFTTNRFIYACYNTMNDIRVSRWKLNETATELLDQKDIITGLPSIASGRHSGCRPIFGADGNLWVGTGDAATGTNPQDPTNFGGKVLRVDREGKGVLGNVGGEFDARIYSFGHRNIQGMVMFGSPKNGNYGFSIEHGSNRDDEVNALIPGNFGWDPVPGYNEAVEMTDTQKFPQAIEAVWSSGKTTIATGGGVIIKGAKWQLYQDTLWMGVLKDKHIRMLVLNADATSVTEEKVLFDREFGRIRTVAQGPDQAVYITTDNGSGKDGIFSIETK